MAILKGKDALDYLLKNPAAKVVNYGRYDKAKIDEFIKQKQVGAEAAAKPQQKDYGFFGNMLRDMTSPLRYIGEGINSFAQITSIQPTDQDYRDYSRWLLTKPESQRRNLRINDYMAEKGKIGRAITGETKFIDEKELQNAVENPLGTIAGETLKAGTYILPAGKAATSLKGAVLQGARMGATGGGMWGFGQGLEEARSGDDLYSAFNKGVTGAITGGVAGGVLSGAGYKLSEWINKGKQSSGTVKVNKDNIEYLDPKTADIQTIQLSKFKTEKMVDKWGNTRFADLTADQIKKLSNKDKVYLLLNEKGLKGIEQQYGATGLRMEITSKKGNPLESYLTDMANYEATGHMIKKDLLKSQGLSELGTKLGMNDRTVNAIADYRAYGGQVKADAIKNNPKLVVIDDAASVIDDVAQTSATITDPKTMRNIGENEARSRVEALFQAARDNQMDKVNKLLQGNQQARVVQSAKVTTNNFPLTIADIDKLQSNKIWRAIMKKAANRPESLTASDQIIVSLDDAFNNALYNKNPQLIAGNKMMAATYNQGGNVTKAAGNNQISMTGGYRSTITQNAENFTNRAIGRGRQAAGEFGIFPNTVPAYPPAGGIPQRTGSAMSDAFRLPFDMNNVIQSKTNPVPVGTISPIRNAARAAIGAQGVRATSPDYVGQAAQQNPYMNMTTDELWDVLQQGLPSEQTETPTMDYYQAFSLAQQMGARTPAEANSIANSILKNQAGTLSPTQKDKLRATTASLNELQTLKEELTSKTGYFGGRGWGSIANWLAQYFPDATRTELEQKFALISQNLLKSMETGSTTDKDREFYRAKLPQFTDTYEEAMAKIDVLMKRLENQIGSYGTGVNYDTETNY